MPQITHFEKLLFVVEVTFKVTTFKEATFKETMFKETTFKETAFKETTFLGDYTLFL